MATSVLSTKSVIIPKPELLRELFLQQHPDALSAATLLTEIASPHLDRWLHPNTPWPPIQTEILAACTQHGLDHTATITQITRFLQKMHQQAWFKPFRRAGWTVRDMDPFHLYYAANILHPLYQDGPQTEDADDSMTRSFDTDDALVRRLIACPWILAQAYWDIPNNLLARWPKPAQLLTQWSRLAAKNPDPQYPSEWMAAFAALILAFFAHMRQARSSVLPLRRKNSWLDHAAHWLHVSSDELAPAYQAMVSQTVSSPRQDAYRQYFSPKFQFIVINDRTTTAKSTAHYALSGLYWQEIRTAGMVRARLATNPHDAQVPLFPLPDHWKALLDAARIHAAPLDDEQRAALTTLWQSPLTILTGPPGSGKTELLALFADLMQRVQHDQPQSASGRLCWMAPTGKAAEQLHLRLGAYSWPILPEDAPRTIHAHFHMYPQLIGWPDLTVAENYVNTLYNGGLVVDEFTMCDTSVLHAIFRMATFWQSASKSYEMTPFRLILAGDPDQLPPVNPGYPLGLLDALDQYLAPAGVPHPHAHLSVIRRNNGAITDLLTGLRDQDPQRFTHVLKRGSNVDYHQADSLEMLYRLLHQVIDQLQHDTPPAERVVPTILAATNQVAILSNTAVQTWQHPDHPIPNTPSAPTQYLTGDKVLYRRNHHDLGLVNGSDGTVVSSNASGTQGTIEWNLPNGHTLSLSFTPQTPIMLSYALTIHKAQGSEWPVVILVAPLREWLPQDPAETTEWDEKDEEIPDGNLADNASDASVPPRTGTRPIIPGWHDRRLIYTAISRPKTRLIILSALPWTDFTQMLLALPVKRRASQIFRSLSQPRNKFCIPWTPKPLPAPARQPRRPRRIQ